MTIHSETKIDKKNKFQWPRKGKTQYDTNKISKPNFTNKNLLNRFLYQQ